MSLRCVMLLCDMEGIAGISSWDQCTSGKDEYGYGRRLYTSDVSAAVRGCKRAGVRRIVAQDGHGAGGSNSFRSILADELEPGAEYVLGHRWGAYTEAFESGCDAALLIGQHARAGMQSCLSHTISGSIAAFRLNGREVSESTLLAALAGSFGVPTVFVSGDQFACQDVVETHGEQVVTAVVKRSTGRFSIVGLSSREAADLIENRVAECLERADFPPPLTVPGPIELRVEIPQPDLRTDYLKQAGVESEGRELVIRGADFLTAWRTFWPG